MLLLVLFPVWTLSPPNWSTRITGTYSSGLLSSWNWNLIASCTWNSKVLKFYLHPTWWISVDQDYLVLYMWIILGSSSIFRFLPILEGDSISLKTLVFLHMKIVDTHMSDWCLISKQCSVRKKWCIEHYHTSLATASKH